MAHPSDGPASSLRMFGHVHRAMCGGGCQFEVLEEPACACYVPAGGGGRQSWATVTSTVTGLPQFRRRKRRLQGLRVWYSVHFGYYFYAARGAILVVKFSGLNG